MRREEGKRFNQLAEPDVVAGNDENAGWHALGEAADEAGVLTGRRSDQPQPASAG